MFDGFVVVASLLKFDCPMDKAARVNGGDGDGVGVDFGLEADFAIVFFWERILAFFFRRRGVRE